MSEKSEKAAMARKYSKAITERQQRKRAHDLWQKLQYEGYDSIEELQRETSEMKALPETWQGQKLREKNMDADDLPPSKKVVETLVKNLKKAPSR
jgi:hypothetical protein